VRPSSHALTRVVPGPPRLVLHPQAVCGICAQALDKVNLKRLQNSEEGWGSSFPQFPPPSHYFSLVAVTLRQSFAIDYGVQTRWEDDSRFCSLAGGLVDGARASRCSHLAPRRGRHVEGERGNAFRGRADASLGTATIGKWYAPSLLRRLGACVFDSPRHTAMNGSEADPRRGKKSICGAQHSR